MRRDSRPDQESLEEQITKETSEVIGEQLRSSKLRRESSRLSRQTEDSKSSALLYISLWEVMHASRRVLHLPDNTLYTAAVVMPMIARSAGYPLTLVAIAVKVNFLMFLCIGLQVGLILSLSHARLDLPGLDGVPSLCTYGQDVGTQRRPYGPTGQVYEKSYGNVETNYDTLMVRNTLYEVMKKVGVENPGLGPVEYGMESSTCRIVCIAVFCVAISTDIFGLLTTARYLYYSPTLGRPSESGQDHGEASAKWIEFDNDSCSERAKSLWGLLDKSDLDHIRIRCAGMPMGWKFYAAATHWVRGFVVLMTYWNGVSFLLNTGGIVDQILNSIAIIFIVELDRLMLLALCRGITLDILKRLKPLRQRPSKGALHTEHERRRKAEFEWGCWEFVKSFMKACTSSLFLVLMTIGGHFLYFNLHCWMERRPLDFTEWGTSSYFSGQTRLFGGWEFVFGSWVSAVTTDTYTGNVTCKPAEHLIGSGAVQEHIIGCGLPTGWKPPN